MENKFEKLSRRKRLLVTRSCKHLFAQIIDIQTGKTLIGLSDKKLIGKKKEKLTKTQRAKVFGEEFARQAVGLKIKEVFFDRGGNLYHGRVKAFAEGAREGGLKF